MPAKGKHPARNRIQTRDGHGQHAGVVRFVDFDML